MVLTNWPTTREPHSGFASPPGPSVGGPTGRRDRLWPYALGMLAAVMGALVLYLIGLMS